MVGRALCILALLYTIPESRPCHAISEIPPGQDQFYLLSKDSVIIDSTGWRQEFIRTVRTIRFTGSAFIVKDSINIPVENPTPQHFADDIIRRDSSGAPPRELDFCNYADSIDTVMAYEDDSLLIAFTPGLRSQDAIRVVFSLQEGLLYYFGTGYASGHSTYRVLDRKSDMKTDYARSYQDRQVGIIRDARRHPKPKSGDSRGFASGIWRFDASGRRLTPGKSTHFPFRSP